MKENQTTEPESRCMRPGCGAKTYARGLCTSCYNAARRLVLQQRLTWETLEADGKCAAKSSLKTTDVIRWLLNPP